MPNIENKLFDTWHSVSAIVSPHPFLQYATSLFDESAFIATVLCIPDPSLPRYFSTCQVVRNFRRPLYPNIDGPQSGNSALNATQIADICERDRQPLLQVIPFHTRALAILDSPENIRLYIYVRCGNDNRDLYNGFTQQIDLNERLILFLILISLYQYAFYCYSRKLLLMVCCWYVKMLCIIRCLLHA